ncbi:MAG TPA: DUF2975 domain-containing protein [Candidatus Wallbacteria bacterium]|nr:DUF2975 domain-containing protein [Candidatus Wallbacteria bacterium]
MEKSNIENISRIKKISSRLRLACSAIFYLLPLVIISYWSFYNELPEGFKSGLVKQYLKDPLLPVVTRILCIAVDMIPGAIIMLSTRYLSGLFSLYEKTVFFSEENVAYIRKLGNIVILWSFMDILKQTLLILAITLNNPPGQRFLAIGIGTFQLSLLLIGYIIVLFARVMDEARVMNDEQQFIV